MSNEMLSSNAGRRKFERRELLLWLGVGLITFTVAARVAYRPDLSGAQAVVMTVVPWVMLVGLVTVFVQALVDFPQLVKVGATVMAIGGWAIIVVDDDRWLLLIFALYAVCYTVYTDGPSVGIGLSALVSAIWAVAWIVGGAPAWTIVFPSGMFVVVSVIALTQYRIERLNEEQADLIGKLRATQRDLAASERSKGILEERARMASEIHASRARILAAGDTARRQVERDLHDGAQQRLVALGLRIQRARRQARSQSEDQLASVYEKWTEEVRGTIEELRAIARGRHPSLLADKGLASAVDALAERAPVPVRLDITSEQLSTSAEQTAYYMIAEGLTNMAKHAAATEARVSVTRDHDCACITIRDNGQGGAKISSGSGLEGLGDRIAATGGTFKISSGSGGTTLSATIPCGG